MAEDQQGGIPSRDTAPFNRYPLLRFPCTDCGAAVGEHCRTATGNVNYDSHAARRAAEGAYFKALNAEADR